MAKGDIHIIAPSLIPWATHMDRYANEPRSTTLVAFEAILMSAFTEAHASTHVITGRLVSSLDMESKHFKSDRSNKWTGTLHIGEGVRYARYEVGDFRKGVRADWAFHPAHSDPFDSLKEQELLMDEFIDSMWD